MPRLSIINLLTKNLITSNILITSNTKKKSTVLKPVEFIKSVSQTIKLLRWLRKQSKSFLYMDSDNIELDDVANLILQKSKKFDFSIVSTSLLKIKQKKVCKSTIENVVEYKKNQKSSSNSHKNNFLKNSVKTNFREVKIKLPKLNDQALNIISSSSKVKQIKIDCTTPENISKFNTSRPKVLKNKNKKL